MIAAASSGATGSAANGGGGGGRPLHPDRLMAQVRSRYATGAFDPRRTIASDDWASLEGVLRLTLASGGLQPWKFITVTAADLRARLLPASRYQAQITDASHLIVFAAKSRFSEADVEEHLRNVARVQGTTMAALAPFRAKLVNGIVRSKDLPARRAWARNQAHIALAAFLAGAALLGIDAHPMEGFDHAAYDEILGLTASGHEAAVIVAAGYRPSTGPEAESPRVRLPRGQVYARV